VVLRSPFKSWKRTVGGRWVAVTPDDNTDIPGNSVPVALQIGTAGNVVVQQGDATDLTIYGLQAGQIIPGAFTRVKSTGTTAGQIRAIY